MKDKFILITGGSGFIGTNLQESLIDKGVKFINIDINPPTKSSHRPYWIEGDIMEKKDLENVFNEYRPYCVIHLAARTDTASPKLEDYKVNYEGTALLIEEIIKHDYVERAIFTSTQYVYKNPDNPYPSSSRMYKPHTVYGQSKMLAEESVHSAGLRCSWSIVRPTNVWGPWHLRYPNQLWKYMDKGLYVHPTKKSVIRSYAYVKNLVHQLIGIVQADKEVINGKTFYLGDLPIDSNEWLSEWIYQLSKGKRKLKHIPSFIMKMAAKFGDILNSINIPFPMYSVRYLNMLENYIAPTDITIKNFGLRNDSLKDNVAETIKWLETDGKDLFEYWSKRK